MSDPKPLVCSMLQFLQQQVREMSDESSESIEVAMQCLESVYGVSAADTDYTLPGTLPEIFAAGVTSLSRSTLPNSKARPLKEVTNEERDVAERLKSEGNEFMKQEKYEDALVKYTEAIEKDNANAVYYCNRAAAHSKLNNNEAALEDCDLALQIDPKYSKAYGRKGLAHSALNQHDKAKVCYTKALELDPDNTSYKQNLDVAEQKLRDGGRPGGPAGAMPPGLGGLNLGGMDFSTLLSNPALMNMATSMLSNPDMQNMMANMMSGAGQQQQGPEGLAGILQAGQQLAQQMQSSNPELVDQLRQNMRNNPEGGENGQPPDAPGQ